MARFNYPIQSGLPSWAQYLPTGSQSGKPAWQISAQGATPSIMWIRSGMIQIEDVNVTVDFIVNNQNLNAAANQYEGITVVAALLAAGTTIATKKWDNKVLNQPYDEWHHAKDDWKRITRVLELPDNHGAEELMVGLVVKASSGYSVVSSLAVVNSYERTYNFGKAGSNNLFSLTQRTSQYVFYAENNGSIITYNPVHYEAFLDLFSVRIRKNEAVSVDCEAILQAISDSDSDVPIYVGIDLRFTSTSGQTYRQKALRIQETTAVMENTSAFDTKSFTAPFDIFQVEPILVVATRYSRPHNTFGGYRALKFGITTSRNLISS